MSELPAFFGTLPGWITAIASSGGFGFVVMQVLRFLPVWRQMSIDVAAAKRGEARGDLAECNAKCAALDARVDRLEEAARALETRLIGALTAYRILDVAHTVLAPDSVAHEQARAVLRLVMGVTELPADILELLRKAR